MRTLLFLGVSGFSWSMLDVASSLAEASVGRTILGIWFLVFAVLVLAAFILSTRSGRDRAHDLRDYWCGSDGHDYEIRNIGEMSTRVRRK